MSVGALKVHADNGLLKTDGVLWLILPALLLSGLGALLTSALPSEILRKGFGAFLIFLSVVTLLKKGERKSEKN